MVGAARAALESFDCGYTMVLRCLEWQVSLHKGVTALFYAPILAHICHEDIDFCAFESLACALHDRLRVFMHSSSFIVVLVNS